MSRIQLDDPLVLNARALAVASEHHERALVVQRANVVRVAVQRGRIATLRLFEVFVHLLMQKPEERQRIARDCVIRLEPQRALIALLSVGVRADVVRKPTKVVNRLVPVRLHLEHVLGSEARKCANMLPIQLHHLLIQLNGSCLVMVLDLHAQCVVAHVVQVQWGRLVQSLGHILCQPLADLAVWPVLLIAQQLLHLSSILHTPLALFHCIFRHGLQRMGPANQARRDHRLRGQGVSVRGSVKHSGHIFLKVAWEQFQGRDAAEMSRVGHDLWTNENACL
eukprot:843041-Rhodomonas_salina.3